jgi:hypothetical protein
MPTSEAVLPFAPGEVDLEGWLYGMSDADYQRAAPQHRALGVFHQDGRRGMVNVEAIGHALLIQHYAEVTSGPAFVELRSARSQAYLMRVWPVRIGVRWTMAVEPATEGSSMFRCTVETELSPVLAFLARLTGVTHAIRRHTEVETTGFAADIERKLRAG